MKEEKLLIEGIPAIIWGESSEKVFIFVHGKLSRKEHAHRFAEIVARAGYQTLSFDLPEHGERSDNHDYLCVVWNGIADLTQIADFTYARWKSVSLYACSLGAYFSLQAYADRPLEMCLFQSPVVDMRWLVEQMMIWYDVSEERLLKEKEVYTPLEPIRLDYVRFIRSHPIENWDKKTFILFGEKDNLQPIESLKAFAEKFNAELTVSLGSQHAFLNSDELLIVDEWVKDVMEM